MDKTKKWIIVFFMVLTIVMITIGDNCETVFASETSVKYRTHIQLNGWKDYSYNGETSGSVGQSLRLEAIELSIVDNPNLSIRYSVHIQDIGWQDYMKNGELSGSTGQAKRLEAIKIELSGEDATKYDIFYRVHAQNYGWLSWTQNGHAAGTEGYGYRLEAIEVELVKKGAVAPELSGDSFKSKTGKKLISYSSHVEKMGWLNYSYDGDLSGTEGLSRRMEAIKVYLSSYLPSGSIKYKAHVQDNGWMSEVSDGALSGTEGESKRIEAISMRLEGTVSNFYGIEYRTHVQDHGWNNWSRDGGVSGSTGESLRLEAIEIRLYKKAELPYEEPEPEPIPTPMPGSEPVHAVYKLTANLWLREAPSAQGAGIVVMAKGSSVNVFEITNGWAKLDFNGKSGYASAKYMEHAYDVYSEPIPIILELNGIKDSYKNENVIGTGVALAYDGIYSLKVLLDGNEINATQYEDNTIQGKYPQYLNRDSGGYRFEIDQSIIKPGDHTITVIMESNFRNTLTKTRDFFMEKNPPLLTINGLRSGDFIPLKEVTISGVALADSGIKEVKYYINGVHSGNALIGLPSDPASYPLYTNNTKGGYSFQLNPTLLNKAINALKVELVGNDGSIEYTSIVIRGESFDKYVLDEFPQSLKCYVDREYVNTQKYIGTGTDLWNKVKANMDPGNFVFNDTNKFIFLDLSYNESDYTITAEVLNNMLEGKGVLSGKGQTFLDAAKASRVNPFYLVAHSLLETGNGTSALATGQKIEKVYYKIGDINSLTNQVPEEDKDKLVYNVFGIKAYDGNALLWGSQFAYKSEWFSVEEAILGGADYISKEYVHRAKPQNTLYRMRFNIADNMTHQYATDIEWAKKQATRIKKQFDDMGVTTPHRFIVPTFVNP